MISDDHLETHELEPVNGVSDGAIFRLDGLEGFLHDEPHPAAVQPPRGQNVPLVQVVEQCGEVEAALVPVRTRPGLSRIEP